MSDNNNELFKLTTKRYLAWGIGGLAGAAIAFTGIWGTITSQIEFVTLAIGGLIGVLGTVVGFYFSKKTNEE